MPVIGQLAHVLRELEILTHAITIVVVRDVLAPVRRWEREPRLLPIARTINNLLPTVHFDNRCDHREHVLADALHQRRLFNHQTVRQFHQHFRATGLGRVHAAGEIVDGFGQADELLRACFWCLARIGELVEVALVLIEIPDGFFVGDNEHHHVPSFFGLADRPVLRARRRGVGYRFQVAMNVCRMRQVSRSANNAIDAGKLECGGDLIRKRKMVDQIRRDAWIGEVLLDQSRVFFVLPLRRLRRNRLGRSGDG